jgi:hypothetical protein
MGPVHSPIQYYSVLKSCVIFFMVQAIAVLLFFSYIWETPMAYRFLMLFINIAISAVLGWQLYKQRYHLVFSYDGKGFTLKQGYKEEIGHKWSEFSKVSLIRTEYGSFSVRLQRDSDHFDLPVSKLRLNPFDFRWEAMKLIEANRKKQSP